jgi:SpoIID/LytB domain protein
LCILYSLKHLPVNGDKLKSIILLFCIFTISNFIPTYSQIFPKEPIVRVRIIYTLDTINVKLLDDWNLSQTTSKEKIKINKNDSLSIFIKNDSIIVNNFNTNSIHKFQILSLISDDPAGTLKIKNVPYGIGWWWEGIEDRIYEGEIEISINGNKKFDVIVTLPLEKYLCGVVPYEIGNDAPLEALKAQVISARSETISALISGKYRGSNFDLCADVECQVFAGNNKRTVITDQAVEETKGLCLFYDHDVIGAYYASNCGGMSEDVENVWPDRSSAVPYWSSHFDTDKKLEYDPKNNPDEWILSNPDVFCNPYFHPELPEWSKKNFRWQVEMTNEELSNNLNEIKQIGALQDIKILERGNSGRIIKARFIGSEDSLDLNSELDIRKIKKPPFRSSCFIFDKIISSDNSIIYKFNGAGWGHGVGMCQSGAVARAFSGQTYEQILVHYFPETEIKSVYNKF